MQKKLVEALYMGNLVSLNPRRRGIIGDVKEPKAEKPQPLYDMKGYIE